jgi:hypothetical protein
MASADSTVEYRDIAGWPGYRVGDDGSVWYAWVNCCKGRILRDRWKRMKTGTHRKGYLYVNLTPPEGGKYKTFRVHRLVLEAFAGPCPAGMECRHLNGIKTDCSLGNILWGTREQNRQDNRDLHAYQRGAEHSQAKITESDVRAIRKRYATGHVLQREIAADYGLTVSNVNAIVNRRSWSHVA